MPGLHVMMFLDLIGRVAGNGNNKVMDLDPTPPPYMGYNPFTEVGHLTGKKTQ